MNQSPLLRPFWFAQAFDCLVKAPDLTAPKSADTTTPTVPTVPTAPVVVPPKGRGGR